MQSRFRTLPWCCGYHAGGQLYLRISQGLLDHSGNDSWADQFQTSCSCEHSSVGPLLQLNKTSAILGRAVLGVSISELSGGSILWGNCISSVLLLCTDFAELQWFRCQPSSLWSSLPLGSALKIGYQWFSHVILILSQFLLLLHYLQTEDTISVIFHSLIQNIFQWNLEE